MDSPTPQAPVVAEIDGIGIGPEAAAVLSVVEDMIFPTPPLSETYSQIRVPVVLRTSGCWFAGGSGEGKSTAVTYCAEALRMEFPSMPVFVLNLHLLPANASRSIPLRLLEEVEHKVPSGETTRVKLRLAKALGEAAMQSPLRQCVLLLDEAQSLRVSDLFLLKDLSNDLARLGVGLLTIMFGESPSMEVLVEKVRSSQDRGLAERFFVRQLQLGTYQTIDAWRSLLENMDHYTFPVLGDRTVPEAFLRDRRGAPYCLTREAQPLWNVVRKMKHPTLRRIFTGIRWWLLHAGCSLACTDEVPSSLWRMARAYAACTDSLGDDVTDLADGSIGGT